MSLTVLDDGGNDATETTTVIVYPGGFPEVDSLSPDTGDASGGTPVTIKGSNLDLATSVRFGQVMIMASDINVVDSTTIMVVSPNSGGSTSVPAAVSVITPLGESNSILFNYVGTVPIQFDSGEILNSNFGNPGSVAFGPDSKLYVGSKTGKIAKISFQGDSFTNTAAVVVSTVESGRHILGIAFDPLDTKPNPTVYCSSSEMFHDEWRNSIGDAINGKILAVNGANMDSVTEVITGLPVSELDHGVNNIAFGDNGELYIQNGSNTNGGIPGPLSGSQKMRENYFSAATLVANLGESCFNGNLAYDAAIDGYPIAGFGPTGVEVFAPGNRNPFGIIFHSNGKVYGTGE